MPENEPNTLTLCLPVESAGKRLDAVLAQQLAQYSRARLQAWIRNGRVSVDGECITQPRHKVMGGEHVEVHPETAPALEAVPEPVPLDIVYEDDTIIVINKQAGQVVHPGAGNVSGTVMNGLLHHDASLTQVPRAGIVHRLDKDTTGLMVVARTVEAQHHLVRQLQARTVRRVYDAIVQGEVLSGGTVETQIGRHPRARKRMAVLEAGGKPAVTHYRVQTRFRGFTHVSARLETGRAHQIRVHMAWLGHPLVGDPVYGRRLRLPKGMPQDLIEALRHFPRQALHAGQLSFEHPETGRVVRFAAEMPEDMAQLMDRLWVATELADEEMGQGEAAFWSHDEEDEAEIVWVTDEGHQIEWDDDQVFE